MILQTLVPENFRSCRWGDERTVKRAQTVSEDPNRREWKFPNGNLACADPGARAPIGASGNLNIGLVDKNI